MFKNHQKIAQQMPKKLLVFMIAVLLSTQFLTAIPTPTSHAANYFIDVSSNHANYKAISTLRRLNIIRGFVDSTFKPDKELTRAELLKLAIAAKGIKVGTPAEARTPFKDVSKLDWFAPYVQFAVNTKIIAAQQNFNPYNPVSRVEAVKIFLNLFAIALPPTITSQPYFDNELNHWALSYVWAVKFRNLLPIDGDLFEPEKTITLGEAAELTHRLLAITTNKVNRYNDDLEVDFSALVITDESEPKEARDLILDRAYVQIDELTKQSVEQVRKSTVNIVIFETDSKQQQAGGGSGIMITQDGYILTNKHVVGRGAEAAMVLYKNNLYDFKIIAVDPLFDLAIIKINSNGFTPAILGDSDAVEIGQTVLSLGYSLSQYDDSLTRGIISGRSRTITASGGGFIETLSGMLQTDAPISPGNSGGPLFNLWGEVIGINTAIDTRGTNLGFAIPINDLKGVIADVIATGELVRPFIGVRFVTLNALIARGGNYGSNKGALLMPGLDGESAIVPGSPAEAAGLQTNDIIF